MVHKVTHKIKNPLIQHLKDCINYKDDFVGKILLESNNETVIFTNNTCFKIYGDYIKLVTPSYPNACLKISSIIGVVA